MPAIQPKNQSVEKEGWVRRFVTTKERVDDFVTVYRSMGFEVMLKPLEPDDLPTDECGACVRVSCQDCVVIFTRPKSKAKHHKA